MYFFLDASFLCNIKKPLINDMTGNNDDETPKKLPFALPASGDTPTAQAEAEMENITDADINEALDTVAKAKERGRYPLKDKKPTLH